MDKQLAFRAWDSKREAMIDNVAIFGRRDGRVSVMMPLTRMDYFPGSNWKQDDYGNYYSDDGSVIPMQCTGLKDANNRMVYVGDIVEGNRGLKKIIWWDGAFDWEWGNENDKRYTDEFASFIEDYKIVGNIYQTPELFKS